MKPNWKHACVGALLAVAAMLLLAALPSVAADEQGQVQALQAALAESVQQTAQSNQVRLQMAAEIDALRRKVAALEEAAKQKDTPPK